MNTLTVSQLVSISELQRNYAFLVKKIKKIAKPLFLLRRNQPEAVLISVPVYEELAKKSRLYEEKLAIEAIEKFEKDRKAGKLFRGKTASDLFKFEKSLD
ncbi:type II toxin-antitoxin system Phd/YefM family antitoxin [Candidatus Microgenomates bacterium]|nr:type II toxin-antitoxin system Phd/YefM family antitoxin [Candidatus Microgenomates bacterium]